MAPLTTTTLDNTLGVALLAAVGASILSGSTFAQAYMYYHTYPQDSILNRCAVGVLCLLDTLHLAFLVHAIYFYCVTMYGNLIAMQSVVLSLKLQGLINIVVALLLHSLYAHRVWMLSGYYQGRLRYLVPIAIVVSAAVGSVLVYVIFSSQKFTDMEESAWALYAALGTSTSIDFMMAIAMCYYLRKSKSSFTSLNSKISKVIRYMISSGLLTSTFSLMSLISYILLPNTFIGISLAFPLTKVYIGSFLAMLNSREPLRVSGPFHTTPNNPWRRSLKVATKVEFLPGQRRATSGEISTRKLDEGIFELI